MCPDTHIYMTHLTANDTFRESESKSLIRVNRKIPNKFISQIHVATEWEKACVGVKIKPPLPALQYVLGPGFFKQGKEYSHATHAPRRHIELHSPTIASNRSSEISAKLSAFAHRRRHSHYYISSTIS